MRRLDDLRDTDRDVRTEHWRSVRMLLAGDGMGFSFHITQIDAAAELPMHYTNHRESVYCISGEGSIEDTYTGKCHPVVPGVIYALDRHDRHVLRATTPLVLACVFHPPLQGREVHDENGAYPASESPS